MWVQHDGEAILTRTYNDIRLDHWSEPREVISIDGTRLKSMFDPVITPYNDNLYAILSRRDPIELYWIRRGPTANRWTNPQKLSGCLNALHTPIAAYAGSLHCVFDAA